MGHVQFRVILNGTCPISYDINITLVKIIIIFLQSSILTRQCGDMDFSLVCDIIEQVH